MVLANRTPGRVAGTPAIVRFATRPRAGASADVGRHPRDYIDPRGAPFSAPLRRVLLRKPPDATRTTTPGHCTLTATCPINHPVYAFFAYTDIHIYIYISAERVVQDCRKAACGKLEKAGESYFLQGE